MNLRRIIGITASIALVAQGLFIGMTPAAAQQTGITGEGFAGDFNGDGKQDVANFNLDNGVWMVGLSSGTRFNFTQWADYAAVSGWTHRIGDFNGDNMDDVFSYRADRMYVAVSTGSSFTVTLWRELALSWTWDTFIDGDFNNDGRDDIAGYHKEAEKWQVYLSSGSGFPTSEAWSEPQTVANWAHVGGDFNGDDRMDIADFNPATNVWRVHISTGSSFTSTRWETVTPTSGWGKKRSGDFNGDGRDDIASFLNGSEWRVSKSQLDNTFNTAKWAELSPANDWGDAVVGDYNADGKDDIANFRTSVAAWYVSLTSGPTSFQTSIWGDLSPDTGWSDHVGGDFTGDGRDDVASFRANTGTWWVGESQGTSFTMRDWNPPNTAPQADFTFQCQGLNCQFTDTSTDPDGRISSWGWNFGDGTTSAEQNPTHAYQSANTYTVTLTVFDDQGGRSETTKSVTVTETDAAPDAQFSYSCKLLTCTFTSKSTDDGEITIYDWDFGDGTTSTAKSPTHRYAKGGSYTVRHTVTDDGSQTDSITKTILVVQPHKRSVGLKLKHPRGPGVYLRAVGQIGVADGFRACKAARKVFIQRKRGTKWVRIATAVTLQDGRYRIYPYTTAPTDRPGVYRALAPREKPSNQPGHSCLKAVSPIRRHGH